MNSETSSDKVASVVAHRTNDRIVAKYGDDEADVVEGTEEQMVALANELLAAAGRGEKTDVEVWEENSEGIYINIPDGAPETWSADEWTAFHDQYIRREVKWRCGVCTTPPAESLSAARRHVEAKHGDQLLEKHVDDEDLNGY